MRIGFVYGRWIASGKKYNFSDLFNDKRGLTGSELSCFSFAREMSRKGNKVSLFLDSEANYHEWENINIRPLDDVTNAELDVVYSWNEADVLRFVRNSSLRMVNLQINDFAHCMSGYDDFVDIWTSPSESHKNYILSTFRYHLSNKWKVLPNGCDSSQYEYNIKVPGRVIYASSPDRGLHWLLQQWPKIRKSVPNANLKVFYRLNPWIDHFINVYNSPNKGYPELGMRARYIKEALRRLSRHGVEAVDSVSRRQISKEMSEAMVLAYPCDTVFYTEGFSVTTLEACAAGVVPVITDVDALGQVYYGNVPMVRSPIKHNIDEFTDFVIRGLVDEKFVKETTEKLKEFSKQYEWTILANKLEQIIKEALSENSTSNTTKPVSA